MPIHVPPISRRSFLAQGAAIAASLTCTRPVWSAELPDGDAPFALLSDTHVPNSPVVTGGGVHRANMTENLKRVVAQLVELKQKPAAVLINGDCDYLKGLPADYENLAGLVKPLSEAGLSLHLTMGNHDDREPLYQALAAQRPQDPPVQSKHVGVMESKHARWILLDSLLEVDLVTGDLGEAQRKWLGTVLDEPTDKPAIVVAHHNPQFEPGPNRSVWAGLRDSKELFELLDSYPQVQAYIYGHTHNWSISRRGRIHLINLPPVAYVFEKGKPNGWVHAQLRDDGIDLELRALDPNHPQHGEKISLAWS